MDLLSLLGLVPRQKGLASEQTPLSALSPMGYPGYGSLNINRENMGLPAVSPSYYQNVYLPQGPRQNLADRTMMESYKNLISGNPLSMAMGAYKAPDALIYGSLQSAYNDSLWNPARRRQIFGF